MNEHLLLKRTVLVGASPNILIFLLMVFLSTDVASQIPMRAEEMADSIVRAHDLCEQSEVIITKKIYYPRNEDDSEIYFFQYALFFNNEYEADLAISIRENFTVEYVNGFPDDSFDLTPCSILPRRDLWKIAKKNGLRTRYKKCNYFLSYSEGEVYIGFHERITIYNMDFHSVNAYTGKYISHSQGNVTF